MNQLVIKNSKISRFLFDFGYLTLALISVLALLFTFSVAVSAFTFNLKVLAFAAIVVFYLVIYVVLNTLQKNQFIQVREVSNKESVNKLFESDIDEKLLILEEAGKFFGASLKSAEMYRLIATRISEIISFKTCAFFQIDERNLFRVPYAMGKNSRLIESISIDCGQGIAGKAFVSGEVECDESLESDKIWNENDFLSGLESSMAIPLFRDREIFCVFVLYSDQKNHYQEEDKILAEAVGERITPLINGSIAFEKSLSNALTDNLTNLPNERAFFLVLENQVAEAQRFVDKRTLTVLAIDIQNFKEINEKYGHSVGDCILATTAGKIKDQVRNMDFLARTLNDEFLIVLPTATEEITEQVITRIADVFENTPYPISDYENCFVKLSFGSATFQEDGESADQLIKTALIRKQQSKPNANGSIVFFPKQFVS